MSKKTIEADSWMIMIRLMLILVDCITTQQLVLSPDTWNLRPSYLQKVVLILSASTITCIDTTQVSTLVDSFVSYFLSYVIFGTDVQIILFNWSYNDPGYLGVLLLLVNRNLKLQNFKIGVSVLEFPNNFSPSCLTCIHSIFLFAPCTKLNELLKWTLVDSNSK